MGEGEDPRQGVVDFVGHPAGQLPDAGLFLELEERSRIGDFTSVVNSMSVYEFTDDDKIRHIDVYLQMALPNTDMLGSYEGVGIAE